MILQYMKIEQFKERVNKVYMRKNEKERNYRDKRLILRAYYVRETDNMINIKG